MLSQYKGICIHSPSHCYLMKHLKIFTIRVIAAFLPLLTFLFKQFEEENKICAGDYLLGNGNILQWQFTKYNY